MTASPPFSSTHLLCRKRKSKSPKPTERTDSGEEIGAEPEVEEEDFLLAAMWDDVVAESKFLMRPVVKTLHGMLPPFQQVNDWELLYSNTVHGNSLQTVTNHDFRLKSLDFVLKMFDFVVHPSQRWEGRHAHHGRGCRGERFRRAFYIKMKILH